MRGTRANTKGREAWVQYIPCSIDIVRLAASRFILAINFHESCVERKLHLKKGIKVAKDGSEARYPPAGGRHVCT